MLPVLLAATVLLSPPPSPPSTPRELGRQMAAERGWTGAEWEALERLWTKESNWNPAARNRRSGACGIMQRYPCRGYDRLDTREQIRVGLEYVGRRYGRPGRAWAHFLRRRWY